MSGDNILTFPTVSSFAQRNERRTAEAINLDSQPALKDGDGGGISSDMEARVSRLERQMDTVAKDVSDMRVDVAGIKENVRHLPTKPWMFATLGGMLTVLAAVIGAIVRFIPHAS